MICTMWLTLTVTSSRRNKYGIIIEQEYVLVNITICH